AGIVGNDAADFRCMHGRGVGADFAPERRQPDVGLGADDARLEADLRALLAYLTPVPVVAEHDQHRIADGLARQAGARRT
nr:hypothetical protein [Tanacetum cinerariifolium]